MQYVYVSLPTDLDPLAFGPGATVTIEVISSCSSARLALLQHLQASLPRILHLLETLCRAWRQSTQCCGLLSPASLAAAA